jgi:hypothetical protein
MSLLNHRRRTKVSVLGFAHLELRLELCNTLLGVTRLELVARASDRGGLELGVLLLSVDKVENDVEGTGKDKG